MNTAITLFAFVLGAISGSFLNVAALRHKVTTILGRSRCPACRHELSWYELIPLVSFIIQAGKCRSCKTKISPRYFVVEFLMGFLFMLLVAQPHSTIIVMLFAVLLQLSLVLVLYDFKHLILPSEYLNTLFFVSLATGFARAIITLNMSIFHAVLFSVGGAVLVGLPLLLLWLVSSGKWIGFGDVRLTFAMGALLGASLGFSALVFSFWIGAVTMLGVLLVQKLWKGKLEMKSMIPFGPFLLVGMWLVLFFPIDLQTVYSLIGIMLW